LAVMKLLEIVTCARPVLFANNSSEFPYSVGGTAFIVKFRGRTYVITAKHVVNLRNFEAAQFCIQRWSRLLAARRAASRTRRE
jgi:hypothetical protein